MSKEVTLQLAEDSAYGKQGQVVTLALTPSDVHDPTELPTYLAGYMPFMYRADQASPIVLVDRDSDKYRNFSSDDAFRRVDVKGSLQGTVPEVDPSSTLNTYKVVDRFVGSFISDITESNAGGAYRPRQVAMRRCKTAIQLDREIDVWGMLQVLASWATGNRTTLGAAFKWNGGATSDPIFDLQERIEASSQPVTGIWMNQIVAHAFLRHPSVRDHMRQFLGDSMVGGTAGLVSMAGQQTVDFAIPGLPPIHVVAAKAKNETTGNLEYVLGNHVVLVTAPAGVPMDGEEIATTWTFRRRGASGVGFETREYRVEGRGPTGGTMVVASMADTAVMTANNAGGLIRDAVQ